MGDRGATGGAWGARDEASWWPASAGELQHQQQSSEDVARSTAANSHQHYTYKMTSGFSNNSADTSSSTYDYRLMSTSATREESPQQSWWYNSGSVESHQQTSPTV